MWKRLIGCVVLLGGLLALPFYFRREDEAVLPGFSGEADRLVIVSAHNKAMRDEYDTAFRNYYRKRFNRDVILDFRSPGGTSDIIRYIDDRFVSEFRNFFESNPGNGKWKKEYTDIFRDSRSAAHPVRKLFMASDVGIGIDIFAGGGTFNHARLAKRGYGVDAGVMKRHPEYFSDKVIPGEFGGDRLYDPAGRYYGVVLSTFGIFCNLDRIREMGLTKSPETWKELGNAEFFDLVVLADPSKSGSANKCYEIIIQQAMAEAGEPSKGWDNGLNLLKKIFANARTITDSASQVVSDVMDALAQALSENEDLQIYTSGATNILKYPELTSSENATNLLSAFEEKEELRSLVNESLSGDEAGTGIQVYIGNETPIQTMKDCSVVTATYELGEGVKGTIGIIGPKRMDYENVMDNLKTLRSQLDGILNKSKDS